MKDTLIIGGHEFHSRFILGSGKYSLEKMPGDIENSGAEIITLALRRANTGGNGNILDYLPKGCLLYTSLYFPPAVRIQPRWKQFLHWIQIRKQLHFPQSANHLPLHYLSERR